MLPADVLPADVLQSAETSVATETSLSLDTWTSPEVAESNDGSAADGSAFEDTAAIDGADSDVGAQPADVTEAPDTQEDGTLDSGVEQLDVASGADSQTTDTVIDIGPIAESGFCGSVVHPTWSRGHDGVGGVVVFTELMLGESGWAELHNPLAVAIDLSGWSVSGALETVFEDGTFIGPGAYLLVKNPSVALPESEAELVLLNNSGRRMDKVAWEDAEPWPAGAFGSGASLSKMDPTALSEAAESWFVGPVGGTPGAVNVPLPPMADVAVVVQEESYWRYDVSGEAAPGWTAPGFDSSSWPEAPAIFAGGVLEASAELVNFRVTADNYFAVYVGAADGSNLRFVGRDTVSDWTSLEVLSAEVGPSDHWFLAAWEAPGNNGGPQMIIAEAVTSDGDVVARTRADAFEWVLGDPSATPGGSLQSPPPAIETIASLVAASTNVWAAPAAEAPRESSPWGATLADDVDAGTNYLWPDTFSSQSITNTSETFVLFRSITPILAPPGNTVLGVVPVTSRFIATFTPPAGTVVAAWLDLRVDDGAVVWLNGQEVHRQNLPAGPVDDLTPAILSVSEAEVALGIPIPIGAILAGENRLAVAVHDAADGQDDLLFGAALTLVVSPVPEALQPSPLRGLRLSELAPTWVELVNESSGPIDVAGAVVVATGSTPITLAGSVLASGERLIVEVTMQDDGRVLLYAPGQTAVLDYARLLGAPQARSDEGQWRFVDATTPGLPNTIPARPTVAVSEVMYHYAPLAGEVEGSPLELNEEWVELHNWGTVDVDVGRWQLVDAVRYIIPTGTVIPAGGFLVVARDEEALQTAYPTITVIGDFKGNLGNSGEQLVLRDDCGNPVDVVPYADGGRWAGAADGGGSSLERRDPRSDGASPESWASSDTSASAAWASVVVEGVASPSAVGPDGQWEELVLGLLDDGTVLIDDVSVVEYPAGSPSELVQNGSFDDLDSWRGLGNHRHVSVVPDPDDPSNAVLKLTSTGPTEHMHNHLETTFAGGRSLENGQTYRISFRARWVSGSNLLHSRLYFNRLAETTRLLVPPSQGTPGSLNSTATANQGPTFRSFRHWPPVPAPGQPVTVAIDAHDPDGVDSVVLWTSSHGTLPMTATNVGSYEATLPGQPDGTIVQMVVTALDETGVAADFPPSGMASRALFEVADDTESSNAGSSGLHGLRLIVTPDDNEWLFKTTNLMSNDLVRATVIVDQREVFHDVGVRIKGSQRGRPQSNRVGFGVRFDPAQRFRGVYDGLNVDRSEGVGFGQREMLMGAVMARAGSVSTEYNDLAHLDAPRAEHTGPVELQLARFGDVLLENQFDSGGDGMLYEYELIYYPATTDDGTAEGLKRPQPDVVVGTSVKDLGDDPERYRQNFILKNNRWRDDYGPLMVFAKTFGQKSPNFEDEVESVIDVRQWLRAFAFATLSGAIDNYASGAQHNGAFYERPEDGLMLYFPHDLDFYGGSPESPIVNNNDLGKLVKVPEWKRHYYAELIAIIDDAYNGDYMSFWCEHLGALLPAQDFDGHCEFIAARAAWVGSQILAQVPQVPFAVTGPVGDAAVGPVTIEGSAWLYVERIEQAGPIDVVWTTPSTWVLTTDIACGPNLLQFEAFTRDGVAIGTTSVTITGVGPSCP